MKKFPTVFGLAMLLSVASAFAQGGTTGPLTWVLNNGTLTISGEGAMPNYNWDAGDYAPWFEYRESINTAIIEPGVTTIGDNAFAMCTTMISITLPTSVTAIEKWAFENCWALASIILPASVTTIERSAFNNSGLTSITIPSCVTTIGINAFRFCTGLTSIILPAGITIIEEGTFEHCYALASITIPTGVTTIGYSAFSNSGLTSVTIPSCVTTIGSSAFGFCTALTSITNLNPVPIEINADVFRNVDQSACILKVPTSSVSYYQNAAVWKNFNVKGGDYYVQVSVNNSEYGYTIGNGLYGANETAIVSATAHQNCKFINWTKNGAEVSKDNPYSFTVTENIELVANFEEGETSITAIETANIKIYPNPTNDKFIIDLEGITTIKLYDMLGKEVLTQTVNGKTEIDINHLPKGVYSVRILSEDRVIGSSKMVKQ
jgi:hypothetical protein